LLLEPELLEEKEEKKQNFVENLDSSGMIDSSKCFQQ